MADGSRALSHAVLPGAAARALAGAAALLFALACLAIYAILPRLFDDYWYYTLLAPDPSWRAVGETLRLHFIDDNNRLANVIFTVMQMLPRPLAAVIPAAGAGWLLVEVARFGKLGARSLPLASLALFLVTFAPPWHEYFFTHCFAMNYVVAGAMAACYFRCLDSDGHASPWWWINAFLLGCFNEAFSGPLAVCAAIFAVREADPAKRRRARSLCLALCAGLLLLAIPIAVRLVTTGLAEGDPESGGYLLRLLKHLSLHWPWALFTLWWGLACIRHRSLRRAPWAWAVLAAMPLTVAMAVAVPRGERMQTLTHILAIMGIVRLAALTLPRCALRNTPVPLAAAAAVTLLVGAHLAAAITTAVTFAGKWRAVDEAMLTAVSGETLVLDFEGIIPSTLAWHKPMPMALDGYSVITLNRYYRALRGEDSATPIRKLMPRKLLEVTADSGVVIPGTAGLRRYGDWYFMPRSDCGLIATYGPMKKWLRFNRCNFTGADCGEYSFIVLLECSFPASILPLTAVDLP